MNYGNCRDKISALNKINNFLLKQTGSNATKYRMGGGSGGRLGDILCHFYHIQSIDHNEKKKADVHFARMRSGPKSFKKANGRLKGRQR